MGFRPKRRSVFGESLPKKPSKMGNSWQKSRVMDRSFQSGWERDRADELIILEQQGIISELKFQPQVYLSAAKIGYKPDFRYLAEGTLRWEEVKGYETEAYQIKESLWRIYGPGTLYVLRKGSRGRFKTVKTIHPENRFLAMVDHAACNLAVELACNPMHRDELQKVFNTLQEALKELGRQDA